jgi:hypothetical protein
MLKDGKKIKMCINTSKNKIESKKIKVMKEVIIIKKTEKKEIPQEVIKKRNIMKIIIINKIKNMTIMKRKKIAKKELLLLRVLDKFFNEFKFNLFWKLFVKF